MPQSGAKRTVRPPCGAAGKAQHASARKTDQRGCRLGVGLDAPAIGRKPRQRRSAVRHPQVVQMGCWRSWSGLTCSVRCDGRDLRTGTNLRVVFKRLLAGDVDVPSGKLSKELFPHSARLCRAVLPRESRGGDEGSFGLPSAHVTSGHSIAAHLVPGTPEAPRNAP